jgi:hypothetical protein
MSSRRQRRMSLRPILSYSVPGLSWRRRGGLATAATLVGGQPGAAAARAVLQRLAATAIFSLVSFDSKGVYDRVCKERRIRRLRARGIPEDLLCWIETFARIARRPFKSTDIHPRCEVCHKQDCHKASLSLILFLFFDADFL